MFLTQLVKIVDDLNNEIHNKLLMNNINNVPNLIIKTDGMNVSVQILNWVLWSDDFQDVQNIMESDEPLEVKAAMFTEIVNEIYKNLDNMIEALTLIREVLDRDYDDHE